MRAANRPLSCSIFGAAVSFPPTRLNSTQLDRNLGLTSGSVEAATGVKSRCWAEPDTGLVEQALPAIKAAMEQARIQYSDLDLILNCSASKAQLIPCTAALIQEGIGSEAEGIPAFDVDATCLSALVGLDVCMQFLESGRCRRILLVSSEQPSRTLSASAPEAYGLFGDAAVALILGPKEASENLQMDVLAYNMRTYSSAAHSTELKMGVLRYPTQPHFEINDALFRMDGRAAFRSSAQHMPSFVNDLLIEAGVALEDCSWVVPHQASLPAIRLLAKRLKIPQERLLMSLPNCGNTVAASLPLTFVQSWKKGLFKSDDVVLMVGTSAGLSIAGMVVRLKMG